MPAPKITMVKIAELRRGMREAPEFQETECSRARAIELMLPDIEVMKSKGYSAAAIATWLSQHGVELSASQLTSGLSRLLEEPAEKKTRRKGKSTAAVRAAFGTREESRAFSVRSRDEAPARLPSASTNGPASNASADDGDWETTPTVSPDVAATTSTMRSGAHRGLERPAMAHSTVRAPTDGTASVAPSPHSIKTEVHTVAKPPANGGGASVDPTPTSAVARSQDARPSDSSAPSSRVAST
jgi:hypothetical protein